MKKKKKKKKVSKDNDCLFTRKDLQRWVDNEATFAALKLNDTERQVVKLHLGGLTFRHIGGLHRVARQRSHYVYITALRKIKQQMEDSIVQSKPGEGQH